jgi:hypothetical protein
MLFFIICFFLKRILKSIERWRVPLAQSFKLALEKKIKDIPDNKYSLDIFNSFVKTSSTFSVLQSELINLLGYYAWTKQIMYFRKIKAWFDNKRPLSDAEVQIPIEKIPLEMMFFVEDAIDQILDDLKYRLDETTCKSNDTKDNETINDVLSNFDHSMHHNWKGALREEYETVVNKTIEISFISKTISIVLEYIVSLRNPNESLFEVQLEFLQEDKQLKQALLDYNCSNILMGKTQFLIEELHVLTSNLVDIGSDMQKHELIRHSIKYGYPLPLSAVKKVADAFNCYLKRSKIYSSGLELIITDDKKNIALSYKIEEGKAKIFMRHFNGLVFLCQADYRRSLGIADKMSEEVDNAFYYEAFIAHLKHLKKNFPKQAESLRAGLLQEF